MDYKDSNNGTCKYKCPHFFMYAKDKKSAQCEKYNKKSNADRISKYVAEKTSSGISKINYSNKEIFNPEILKNSNIEVKRTSDKYIQLRELLEELKKEHSALYKQMKKDLKAKESDKQLFIIYCSARIKEIISDRKEAVNYLVDIEYHSEEFKKKKKDILWNCFGDILYENLCGNVEGGIVIAPRRDVYQSSAKREKEIVESREKIKEQDELQKVFITSNVYDYLMDATTRKGCENDRYVLFVLYVLIERYRKRYGEDNDYIRLYKGLKQKNKFTPATIDGWIDTKITSKALDRLERHGYIKREVLQKYDKIYILDIPQEQGEELFVSESVNPLLDLWEFNEDRKIGRCEICNKKIRIIGNTKTCSTKCSTLLGKSNKNKKQ